MNPRILVTGGTGLLGSYMLRWFRQHGYTNLTATYQNGSKSPPADLQQGIEWKKLVLPDIQDAYEIINGQDWVIHSAAYITYNKSDKAKLLAINQEGTKHIVNACLEHQVKHLIYVGSIGALGKEKNFATLNEASPWLQNEFSTTYGLSKYLGELEAWRGATEGLNVTSILPSVILGTGDWQRSSLQIFDRVAKKSGWYPGGQTGYVDVRDISNFIGLILEKNKNGERWILNGENLSYEKIYKMIGYELGLQKNFRLAPRWLAKIILYSISFMTGKQLGKEILGPAYATFSYDHAKSLELDGFSYRPIEETIREISEIYKSGDEDLALKIE
jgi:nucleoside-diphosphate-sugar epimerase